MVMVVTLSFCWFLKCEACQLEYLHVLVAAVALNDLEDLICRIGNLEDAIPVGVADAFYKIHSGC